MAFKNRIRLPVRTKWPQFPEERQVFRFASGVSKTISVQVRKTYQFETTLMPERLHERLKIALAHDIVAIENEKLLSGVVQEGAYTIEWPEFQDFPLAKGNTIVQVTPFDATNSNCKTCEEFAQVVAEDDEFPNPLYETGLQEGVEYSLDLSENDSVCCYPAVWSLVSYNTDYLDAAAIDDETGLLSITLGTSLAAGNNILLATYRITCPNGDYDEANVYGDVDGSEPGCFGPENIVISSIESDSIIVTFDDPAIPPAAYEIFIYAADNLVDVLYAASGPAGSYPIPGLSPETDYIVRIIGNCAGSDSSPVDTPFTTAAPSEESTCGQYELTMDDGTPDRTNASVTYIDCDGDERTVVVINTNSRIICALQTSPGNPVMINSSSGFVTDEYLGLC